jgi:hypothetical protein
MNKMINNLFLFIFLFLFGGYQSQATTAEPPKHWIDLEWDEVPGALGYDLELFEIIGDKEFTRGIFHSDKPHWARETPTGKYNVKIRALDNRKVPGPWGEAISVVIQLDQPQLIQPLNNESFTASEFEDLTINFQWNKVTGATLYHLVVFNSKNQAILNQVIKENEFRTNLSKIDNYKWYVLPLMSSEDKKEANEILAEKTFQIRGPALSTPVVDIEIISKKGIVFLWEEVSKAENYNFEIFKLENKEFKKSLSGSTNKPVIAIAKEKLPEGKYLVAIKALAQKYRDSEIAKITIKTNKDNIDVLKNESHSKDSTNRGMIQSSLETQFGYPIFKYSSQNFDKDSNNTESLRGIEIETQWRKNLWDSKYFNLLKFDIAQAADSNVSAIFANLSENIGTTIHLGRSKIFLALGTRIDSIPLLYADRFENKILKEYYRTAGFDFNLHYNYRWNSLWASDFKMNLNSPLISLSSSDGAKLKSSLNHELELKLRYTLNSQFDLYSGIKLISYSLNTIALSNAGSYALPSDINTVSFSSTHLMFGTAFFY